MDKVIKNKARVLVRKDEVDEAEALILKYLKKKPKDSDAWITLALAEITPRFEDHRLIFKWMDKLLAYDPFNAHGLLVLSYVHTYMAGGVPEAVFHRLDMIENESNDILAMIEVAKAWFHIIKYNYKDAENALRKSIQYCDQHQINFSKLGELLINQGKTQEGIKYLKRGIDNVTCILSDLKAEKKDPLCIEMFLDEGLRGISLSISNYEYLKEDLERATLQLQSEDSDDLYH